MPRCVAPRMAVYVFLSLLSTMGTLLYAWQTRVQFYPTVIFLVTSKASVLVLCNMFLCMTILFGKLIKTIFLGSLRDREVEVLWENSRFTITNTCLALTIFREELGVREAGLFMMLIFSKNFHWVCRKRIEFMEGREDANFIQHIRIVSLKALLLASDLAIVAVAVYVYQTKGPTVWILFGFEYLCMSVLIISTFLRYTLYLRHLLTPEGWNSREVYQFYLDLVTDVINLAVYLAFFFIIFTYYGVPLHIVRDLYISFRNLTGRIQECCRARSLTNRLSEVLEDASTEQLADSPLCIVCRDQMTESQEIKVLPCGHIFHLHCLQHWIRQRSSCPVCRSHIDETSLRAAAAARERAVLNAAGGGDQENAAAGNGGEEQATVAAASNSDGRNQGTELPERDGRTNPGTESQHQESRGSNQDENASLPPRHPGSQDANLLSPNIGGRSILQPPPTPSSVGQGSGENSTTTTDGNAVHSTILNGAHVNAQSQLPRSPRNVAAFEAWKRARGHRGNVMDAARRMDLPSTTPPNPLAANMAPGFGSPLFHSSMAPVSPVMNMMGSGSSVPTNLMMPHPFSPIMNPMMPPLGGMGMHPMSPLGTPFAGMGPVSPHIANALMGRSPQEQLAVVDSQIDYLEKMLDTLTGKSPKSASTSGSPEGDSAVPREKKRKKKKKKRKENEKQRSSREHHKGISNQQQQQNQTFQVFNNAAQFEQGDSDLDSDDNNLEKEDTCGESKSKDPKPSTMRESCTERAVKDISTNTVKYQLGETASTQNEISAGRTDGSFSANGDSHSVDNEKNDRVIGNHEDSISLDDNSRGQLVGGDVETHPNEARMSAPDSMNTVQNEKSSSTSEVVENISELPSNVSPNTSGNAVSFTVPASVESEATSDRPVLLSASTRTESEATLRRRAAAAAAAERRRQRSQSRGSEEGFVAEDSTNI